MSERNETTQRKPVRLRRWLIAGTLVVLMVSAFVYGLPIYRAHLLISEIRQRGGYVHCLKAPLRPPTSVFDSFVARWDTFIADFDKSPYFVSLPDHDLSEAELNRLLARLHTFDDLTVLYLSGTQLTDEGLGHIAGLKRLMYLDASNTRVGDMGMKHIARLERLDGLILSATRVTDAGLQQLQKLKNLERLSLSGTKVSDAGLKSLYHLKHLSELELSNTSVTDDGVSALLQKLPGLDISDD